MKGSVRIGISGWTYAGWRSRFYPADLPRSRELEYASRRFNSIEINGSFYRMQTPESYRRLRDATPAAFVFAVKGSRFITHNKKLADIEVPLANFFASGLLFLEDKLGPILWQLSPRLIFSRERVAAFLDRLPHDTAAAARLARHHDDRVKSPGWPERGRRRRVRHALEVRHPSSLCPELVRIARDSGTALVFSDSASWPYVEELTAGFVYLRLHGAEETYASGYDDEALDGWAARIRAWRDGGEPADPRRIIDRVPPRRRSRDVYVYFDNDAKVRAPFDAIARPAAGRRSGLRAGGRLEPDRRLTETPRRVTLGPVKSGSRSLIVPGAIVAALVVGAVAYVAASLRRPEPPTFAPAPIAPRPAGETLVGPERITIDASHDRAWRAFDFSRGSRIEDPGPLEWDLAFRRNRIIVNGGPGFAGRGGAVDLGEVSFDAVTVAPPDGYAPNVAGRDTVHPALDGWYDYGFTTHVLTPKPRVYAVRTADGRYAKIDIVSYYCPGARPGCTTFRYVYQGDGSRSFGEGP